MAIIDVQVNISDDALTTAHDLRGAMPFAEFLSYCVQLGIADMRDQYQTHQRDFLMQTMHASMAQHQRTRPSRDASVLKELPRQTEERQTEE